MPTIDSTRDGGVRYDVVAIGNALVDVIAAVEDQFLDGEQVVKGSMTQIAQRICIRASPSQLKQVVVLQPTPRMDSQASAGEQASSAKSQKTILEERLATT